MSPSRPLYARWLALTGWPEVHEGRHYRRWFGGLAVDVILGNRGPRVFLSCGPVSVEQRGIVTTADLAKLVAMLRAAGFPAEKSYAPTD